MITTTQLQQLKVNLCRMLQHKVLLLYTELMFPLCPCAYASGSQVLISRCYLSACL